MARLLLREGPLDRQIHALGTVEHVAVRKPHHPVPAAGQIVVANRVVCQCDVVAIRVAVDLDDQPGVHARKVSHIVPDSVLLAKMISLCPERIQQSP
jgi:hypothetical protein